MSEDESIEHRHRRELHAVGTSDRVIRKLVHAQQMHRVWRGGYHKGGRLPPWDELALSAMAAAERAGPAMVLSHAAAAAVLGMQVLTFDHRTVEFTRDGNRGGGKEGRRRVYRRRLDPEDVTVVNGVAVTTIARTAVDLALAGTFEQAVCAIDAALRMGVATDELTASIGRLGRRRGIAVLRAALAEGTPLSDSVGESWSRALMLKWPEIPRPELQREFFNEAGALEARADFLWSDLVVGEFDGKCKQKKGFTSERRIQRDSLLMSRGLKPTHWDWGDCKQPDRLHTKLVDILGPHGLLLDGASRRGSHLRPRMQRGDGGANHRGSGQGVPPLRRCFSTRSTLAESWPVCPGRMSHLTTRETRGAVSARRSTHALITPITSSHSPSMVVNIDVVSLGRPEARTMATASATAAATPPSAAPPVPSRPPIGLIENAASMVPPQVLSDADPSSRHRNSYASADLKAACLLSAAPPWPPSMFS